MTLICPRTGAVLDHTGTHLLIDLFEASWLADVEYVQSTCEEAARATGATVLGANFHHFGEGHGVSGVVLLAESHLSIHTWPEFGITTLDVFVCGDCDPRLAIPVLQARFAPGRSKVSEHRRGVLPEAEPD